MTATVSGLPRLGPRIQLRRLTPGDLEPFQAYRHDREVGRYQGWNPWPDERALAFLQTMELAPLLQPGEWCQIGIADRAAGALIGDIGMHLDRDGNEAEIGFTLRAESQGQGLGSEAVQAAIDILFECTSAIAASSVTDRRNHRAAKLLERIGMQRVRSAETVFKGAPCIEDTYRLDRA